MRFFVILICLAILHTIHAPWCVAAGPVLPLCATVKSCTLRGCGTEEHYGSAVCLGKLRDDVWVFATVRHAVDQSQAVYIGLNGKWQPARYAARFGKSDAALIEFTTAEKLDCIALATDLRTGQRTATFGYANVQNGGNKTTGVVYRLDGNQGFWQFASGRLGQGDSGGAVVVDGRLAGVIVGYGGSPHQQAYGVMTTADAISRLYRQHYGRAPSCSGPKGETAPPPPAEAVPAPPSTNDAPPPSTLPAAPPAVDQSAIEEALRRIEERLNAIERKQPQAGPPGPPGEAGPQGPPGTAALGPDQAELKALIARIAKLEADVRCANEALASQQPIPIPESAVANAVAVWLEEHRQELKGPAGRDGERGPAGPQGEPGADGLRGQVGQAGTDGKNLVLSPEQIDELVKRLLRVQFDVERKQESNNGSK